MAPVAPHRNDHRAGPRHQPRAHGVRRLPRPPRPRSHRRPIPGDTSPTGRSSPPPPTIVGTRGSRRSCPRRTPIAVPRTRRSRRCARPSSASPTPTATRSPTSTRSSATRPSPSAARPAAARRRTRPRSRSTRTTPQPRRRHQRLPRVQHPRAAQRRLRLGLHLLRRRQDLEEHAAAAPDLPDRRHRRLRAMDSAGDPVARVRPAQHRLLRQHRLQPGRTRPPAAPRPPTASR